MERFPGRHYKMTETTVGKLEQAFAFGASVKDACIYAGISRDTYYAWKNENAELSDRFEALQINPVLKALKTIVDNLNDPKIAAWYLEKKRRYEYGRDIEHLPEEKDPYEAQREMDALDAKLFLDQDGDLLMPSEIIEELLEEDKKKLLDLERVLEKNREREKKKKEDQMKNNPWILGN